MNQIIRISSMMLMIFCSFAFLTSCISENAEELYPPDPCMIGQVTYEQDIEPILRNSCYACHDAANVFGGVNLEGYTNVLPYTSNDKLLGTIKGLPDFPFMPRDGQMLSECNISIIEAWIDQGTPEN